MHAMISVCLASYNGEHYIKEQLNSILSQIGHNDEVIISDDGSSDNTIRLIEDFKDSRIKIYFNRIDHGYTPNFENALKHATGEFIFLCDQDDIWCADKVKICLRELDKYDIVIHDSQIINSTGSTIHDSYFKYRKVHKSFIGNILKFGFLGCSMAFRSKILKKALPFPSNHILCTHDNWIFLIGKLFYRAKIIDDKLILYRRHMDNTSNGGAKSNTSLFFKFKYRLYLINNLVKRLL